CPISSHEDSQAQNTRCKDGPWQRGAYPFAVALEPKSGDAIGKRYQGSRESKEERRRVNHHPIILEQWVQSVSVLRDKFRIHLKHRGVVHHLAKQDKRGTTDLQVDTRQYYAEDHRGQKGLDECKHRHYRRFPKAVRLDEDNSQCRLPEHPQEKTSFLAVPEGGDQVVCRKATVGIIKGVVVFKVVP